MTREETAARLGLAGLIGVGVVVAMYRSLVSSLAPPIPYKLIPDLRPVVLFGLTFAIAAFAAWGPGRRRGFLIAYLLSIHSVFSLELSTIHWFAPYPGPIGGTRADPVRLAAALSGLGAALLLQVRTHAQATRRDAEMRGVPAPEASSVADAMRRAGRRAVLLAAGGAVVVAVAVELAAVAAGDEGSIPLGAALVLGAVVLAGVGLAIGVAARRAA